MSGSGSRKPLLVVGVCAVIAVLVLVLGVSCGGGNDAGARGWQESLAGPAGNIAADLTVEDLEISGGRCTASDTQLLVTGSCMFEVKEFGGALGLGPSTKRGMLVAQQAVSVELFVQGTRIEQDVEPGKEISLTFGTSGGRLGVTCLSVSGCTLQLTGAG